MRGRARFDPDSSLSDLDEMDPPRLDRPPLLWPGLRGVLGTVFAVVSVILLQVILTAYYWTADPDVSVALRPVWDLPAIVLLLVLLAAAGAPRWAGRLAVIILSVAVFCYFVIGVGQGFALREFGYDVVLRLHIAYVPELFRMMYGEEPLRWFIFYCALLALGVVALALIVYGTVRHLHAFSRVGRRRQVGLVVGVAAGFAIGALTLGTSGPVTKEAYNQLDLAVNLKARLDASARRLDMEGAGLRHLNPFVKASERPDILVFVVESYGHVLFTDPAFSQFPPWLQQKGAELEKSGYRIASKTMASPVFGGSSWLAASSLLCGVRIYNQKRFEGLYSSQVRCLPEMLNEAGYRTVIAAANTKYLEDRFARKFPFDRFYFLPDLAYRGPRMGWSFMPDQYVIDFVDRREIQPHLATARGAAHEPMFATLFLTTSHHPWSVIPPFFDDWSKVGDGSIYNQVAATQLDNGFVAGADYKSAYRTSIQYSLQTVAAYLKKLPPDDRSVVIILGDHQPRRPVAGIRKDTWFVPIHVLSRDPAVLEKFARIGYTPGTNAATPKQGTPSGLEKFVQELFTAYGADSGGR
jgi:hypothetical protein